MGLFTSTPKTVSTPLPKGGTETRTYGASGSLDKIQHTDSKGNNHEHHVGHSLLGPFVGSEKKK